LFDNLRIMSFFILLPTGPILISFIGIFLGLYKPRFGRLILMTALFSLLVLSTPFFASLLMSTLQNYSPISQSVLNECQAIVVLGGGSNQNSPEYETDTIGEASLVRLRYAIHLKKLSGLPILASGGSPLGGKSESLIMQQTSISDFLTHVDWIESGSNNTYENAKLSAEILKNKGIYKIALVSHAWHLYRAVPQFEAEGINASPAPTSFYKLKPNGIYSFFPEAGAMTASNLAIHEWLGIFSYKILY